MLEESCRNFDRLNEQASQKENNLQEDLRKASNVLEQANYALAEKTSELNKVEFELEQQNGDVGAFYFFHPRHRYNIVITKMLN